MLTELSYNGCVSKWTPQEIKALQAKLGLSQIEFADLLGVTRTYVYLLGKGVKVPGKTLTRLLDCVEMQMGKEGRKEHGKGNL